MANIETHQVTLSNGLRVVICPEPSSPVVNVSVMYRVGSYNERHERTGLAHLFEHLMFDNASPENPKQYDVLCARAGGANNAYTTFDYTLYHIDLPAHQAEIGFWLESERLRSFRITDHALATQRSVVVEEINQNVFNQPYGIWRKAQNGAAYSNESTYSWDVYGSADHVAAVSMNDADGFFHRFYQPGNAVLSVSGAIQVDRAIALAEQYFGTIEATSSNGTRQEHNPDWQRRGVLQTVSDSVPMPAIYLAIHLPGYIESDLLEAEIAATILGSGRSSVLYQALVTGSGIASSVGAFVDRRANASLLTLYAFGASGTVTSQELLDAMYGCLQNHRITSKEIDTAVNKLRTSHAAELQKASGVSETVAWSVTFRDDPNFVNTILPRYKEVQVDSVASLVRQLATPSETVAVVINPKE